MTLSIRRPTTVPRSVAVVSLLFLGHAALAEDPFTPMSASGPFIISLGSGIKPAGVSGRFVVPSRRVLGFVQGSMNTAFMIQFSTNVPIATQSGTVHGEVFFCENASLIPGLEALGCLDPATIDIPALLAGDPSSLDTATLVQSAVTRTARTTLQTRLAPGSDPAHPLLTFDGGFTFTAGTQGHGQVLGSLTLILDAEGHIVGLGQSNLEFEGVWRP